MNTFVFGDETVELPPIVEEEDNSWTQLVAGDDDYGTTLVSAPAATKAPVKPVSILPTFMSSGTPPAAPLPMWKIAIGIGGIAVVAAGLLALVAQVGRR